MMLGSGIWFILPMMLGPLVGAMTGWMTARYQAKSQFRKASGTVGTAEAGDIFKEGQDQRAHDRDLLTKLEVRLGNQQERADVLEGKLFALNEQLGNMRIELARKEAHIIVQDAKIAALETQVALLTERLRGT